MTQKILILLTVFIFMFSCAPDATGGNTDKDADTSFKTVSAPVFSQTEGQYFGEQKISITTATTGAVIKYTTDGSDPTSTTGTTYQSELTISNSTVVKAAAFKSGMNNSTVTTAIYNIINWKGEFTAAPEAPVAGWAYYNSTDGISYIYDGSKWNILAKDGKDAELPAPEDTLINVNMLLDTTISSSVVYNSKLYFSSNHKIYQYDGTTIKEIISDAYVITEYNNNLIIQQSIYSSETGVSDQKLYTYDGTSLTLVNKGTSSYSKGIDSFIIYGSKLLFKGESTSGESALYEYDGTSISDFLLTQGTSDAVISELNNAYFMLFTDKLLIRNYVSSVGYKFYFVNTDKSLSNADFLNSGDYVFSFNNKGYFLDNYSNGTYSLNLYDATSGVQKIADNISTGNDGYYYIYNNYLYLKKDGKLCRYDGSTFTDVIFESLTGTLGTVSFYEGNVFIHNNLIYTQSESDYGRVLFVYDPETNLIKKSDSPFNFVLKDTKDSISPLITSIVELNGKFIFNGEDDDYGSYISE